MKTYYINFNPTSSNYQFLNRDYFKRVTDDYFKLRYFLWKEVAISGFVLLVGLLTGNCNSQVTLCFCTSTGHLRWHYTSNCVKSKNMFYPSQLEAIHYSPLPVPLPASKSSFQLTSTATLTAGDILSWMQNSVLTGPQNSVFWLGWFCPCQYPCLVLWWVMMSFVLRRYWHTASSRNFAECTVWTLLNDTWSQGAESGIWCLQVLLRLGMCSTSMSSTVCCWIVNFITTWLLS